MKDSDPKILRLLVEKNIAFQARNEALLHTVLYELATIRAKMENRDTFAIREEQMETADSMESDLIEAYLGDDNAKLQ